MSISSDHLLGRDHDIVTFLEDVHNRLDTSQNIRFVSGIQGIGKSFLLDFLRRNLAFWQDWEYIKGLDDAKRKNFVPSHVDIEQGLVPRLPTAFLDFTDPPKGIDIPQDPIHALLSLVRQYSAFGLEFHYFSFGALLYLTRRGDLGDDAWKTGFPHDEFGLAIELLRSIQAGEIPGTGLLRAGIKIWEKVWGSNIGKKWYKRGLDSEVVSALFRLDPQRPLEVLKELPSLFAKDLQRNLAKPNPPNRILLFLDAHEALWAGPNTRAASRYDLFSRDEWLRRLLRELSTQPRILVVVTGDSPPLWHEATTLSIARNELENTSLNGFEGSTAKDFLKGYNVPESQWGEALQLSQIDLGKEGHHPLTLSMFVEHSRMQNGKSAHIKSATDVKTAKFSARGAINRIMRYADREQAIAIEALATCLDFDYDLYKILGDQLGFATSRSKFDELVQAPYVRIMAGDGKNLRYRVVELVKQAVTLSESNTFRAANHHLLAHYKILDQQGDPNAKVRWLHHFSLEDQVAAAQAMTDELAVLLEAPEDPASSPRDPAI